MLKQGQFNTTAPWKNLFQDSHSAEILDGFRLTFHDPFELPSASSQKFHTLTDYNAEYLIVPEMTTIDESMLVYEPEEYYILIRTISKFFILLPSRRNCFLQDEKFLIFFKFYTRSNCEHECVVNVSYKWKK